MSLADVLASVQKSFDFRKEATIGGIPFELSILTLHEEQKISAISADDQDPMQYISDLRKQLLSYAIKKINGEAIPDIVNTSVEGTSKSEERPIYLKGFLDKIPGAIIESLFDVYVDLKEESNKNIQDTTKYNWFKTPEQREAERVLETAKREKAAEEASATKGTDDSSKSYEDIHLKPIPKTEEPEVPENESK
jgi:hypothetical protein